YDGRARWHNPQSAAPGAAGSSANPAKCELSSSSPQMAHCKVSNGLIRVRQKSQTGMREILVRSSLQIRHSAGNSVAKRLSAENFKAAETAESVILGWCPLPAPETDL